MPSNVLAQENDNGGDNPPSPGGQDTPISITIGDVVLMSEGKLTEAYSGFEGVAQGKLSIEEDGFNGFPTLSLCGYDGSGKELSLEGTDHLTMLVKSGTTSFDSIKLGENIKIDGDADSNNGQAYLKVANGITSGKTLSYLDKNTTNGSKYTYKVVAYRNAKSKKVTGLCAKTKSIYRVASTTITSAKGGKRSITLK